MITPIAFTSKLTFSEINGIPVVIFPSMILATMEAFPTPLFRMIHLDSVFRIQNTYNVLALEKRNQKNSNGINTFNPNINGRIRVRKQKEIKMNPLFGSSRLSNQ